MRTIICLHHFTKQQQELVRSAAPDCRLVFEQPGDKLDEQLYREAEVICGWNASVKEVALAEGSALRWLQSASSGIDKMPLDLLEQREIVLTDASGVHARSVSETALALMLGLSRGIAASVRNQQQARWDGSMPLAEMNGGTVAIVGAGQIGSEVSRLARAFDMRVVAVRRSGGEMPGADVTYDNSRLDEALEQADYVVNILPLTDETYHLFDAERFARMKPTACFINVGRGATVQEEALVEALKSGVIAGAGLDVFEQEPLLQEHPLWSLPNVIVTPHIAGGMTVRNKARLVELFAANLKRYMSGGGAEALRNLVDFGKRY